MRLGINSAKDLKVKLSGYFRSCRYADILVSVWCASSFVGLVRAPVVGGTNKRLIDNYTCCSCTFRSP